MDMPMEGGKLAPPTFRGDSADVGLFLRRFERLAVLHHLTEQERCETVTDYCGRMVRETIEGFKAYQEGNWEKLKADIRKFWNADLQSKRFRVRDLEALVMQTQKQGIHELEDWRKYQRNFIRIAGWLRGQGKLTDDDYAYYMWIGLHPRFRSRLESRILLEDPNHDMSEPFMPESISKAAEAILGIQRFDTERLSSDHSFMGNLDEDDYRQKKRQMRSMQDDDEEEELRVPTAQHLPKRSLPKQDRRREAPSNQRDKFRGSLEEDEFDKLVDRMQALSLDDPKYGILYMKACKLNPLAVDCLYKPVINQVSQVPVQEPKRDIPPHIQRQNPNRFLQQRGPPPLRPNGCYGCGEPGHILRDCFKMQDLLNQRIVLKDYHGRFIHPEGGAVRHEPGETLLQAIKRVHPEVHLITCHQDYDENQDSRQYADVMVYPVERSQRETRSYRKQASGGPRASQIASPEKGRKEAGSGLKPAYAPPSFPAKKPTPVETHQRAFNPDNDTEMIDGTVATKQNKTSASGAQGADKPRPANRTSQISKDVNPGVVLDKILDTPVTLPIREIVGSSKEVSACLQDAIKVKKVDFTQPITSNLVTKNKQDSLIHIEMKYKDTPIDFIVDTGSELNIISQRVYDMFEGLVINPAEAVTMRDANGGSSKLLGLVQEIPLKIGPICTPVDAYVSTSPAFSGVLGRPWQREHHIGIEEREEGTFLTFPNDDGISRSRLRVPETYTRIIGPGPPQLSPESEVFGIVAEWSANKAKVYIDQAVQTDPDLITINSPAIHEQSRGSSIQSSDEELMDIDSEENSANSQEENGNNANEAKDPLCLQRTTSSSSSTTDDSLEERIDTVMQQEPWDIADEDTIFEKRTYHVIKDRLQQEIPEIEAIKSGPCTVITDISLEFSGALSPVNGQTFLLRDAKIFNKKGGYYGHAVVQVFPYGKEDLAKLLECNNDTSKEPMICHLATRLEEEQNIVAGPILTNSELVRCPVITLDIHIEGAQVPFVLDTGSEINCISAKLWELLCDKSCDIGDSCKIIGVTGQQLQCLGIWETSIEFNMIWSITKLHIIKGLKVPGILGCPWQRANQLRLEHTPDGINIQVKSPEKSGLLPMTTHIVQTVRKHPEYASMPASSLCGITMEQSSNGLDLDIAKKITGYDPWKPDEDTGELLGDDPLPSMVNVENRLYQRLLGLFEDKAGRNMKKPRPKLEFIEPFEVEQVDCATTTSLQIPSGQEIFLFRNVLLKINGKYQEGHGILHMVYFPHETERMQAAEIDSPISSGSDKSLDLGENNAVEQFYAQFKPYHPTIHDLQQSMMEMGFEYKNEKSSSLGDHINEY